MPAPTMRWRTRSMGPRDASTRPVRPSRRERKRGSFRRAVSRRSAPALPCPYPRVRLASSVRLRRTQRHQPRAPRHGEVLDRGRSRPGLRSWSTSTPVVRGAHAGVCPASIDFAWLPPIPFVALERGRGRSPLSRTTATARSHFHSVIVAHRASGPKRPADLVGKRAAWAPCRATHGPFMKTQRANAFTPAKRPALPFPVFPGGAS